VSRMMIWLASIRIMIRLVSRRILAKKAFDRSENLFFPKQTVCFLWI
jgi:hypothetical protein